MDKKQIIMIAVAVVVGVGLLLGGYWYGNSSSSCRFGNFSGNTRGLGDGNGIGQMSQGNTQGKNMQQGGGFISGKIIKKDDSSMTIQLTNGGSKIILLSDLTSVYKSSLTSINDIPTDETVTVIGSTNEDGSITAKSIHIGDTFTGKQFPVQTQSSQN